MSYSAYISFKAIEADKVYPFVQSMKTMALNCLGEIAKAEWPYCPLVRYSWIESTDEYTAYCRDHPKEFSESEAWFLRVFSFHWFYDTKWKMLGVYAVPSAMRSLFDGTVCFQNSTDQDYFRGEWDGIPVFEQIYDQWVVGKGDEFIKRKLIKNKSYKAEEITSKLLDYARRTFAYEEIWSRIEPTLYDDDHAVFLSLFSSIYDIRARDKFLRMCFQNAVVPKLDKEV